MTSTELKAQIDSQITNETTANAITPTDVGTNLKDIVDYVDQEIDLIPIVIAKTSGSITLSATPQVLPYDTNSCSFSGGKAYLPATTEINREILVIATANNIEIRANVANSAKMFTTFNTFITSVTLAQYEMYRFTYIGFGTEGYWKAELI
ncbi:MAG: hypothetical protein ACOVNT_09840 [Flavobacterium macrobrachii]|jgi:hypothetical protein